jgi:hypothetical protein
MRKKQFCPTNISVADEDACDRTIGGFARATFRRTEDSTNPAAICQGQAELMGFIKTWGPGRNSQALLDLQQNGQAFTDFIKQFSRSRTSHFDISLFPRHAASLIREYDAGNSVPLWNRNLKGITAYAACNWTHDTKTGSRVVLPRRQHDRWTMAALFVAKRGVQINPD